MPKPGKMITGADVVWTLVIVVGVGAGSMLWPIAIGAGFQPTSSRTVARMLDMAAVGPEDVVYDLGSGDGRIVRESARRHARAVGIEADPTRVFWSRMMITRSALKGNARIIWGNLFKERIGEATVVTIFLMEGTTTRLKAKFERELKPGTRIVSHVWKVEGWNPKIEDREREIYLYVI